MDIQMILFLKIMLNNHNHYLDQGDADDKEFRFECFYTTVPDGNLYGQPKEVKEDDELKYILLKGNLVY